MSSQSRHPNQRELASLPVELRRTNVPDRVRAWVAQKAGATIVRAKRLPGASSTAVHSVYLTDGRRFVLRRYSWPGFLDEEPMAPRREVDALLFAVSRGLPVPEVIAADVTGTQVGDGVPVVLMAFVPGRAVPVPDLNRLAQAAAAIHDIDAGSFPHPYFPWYAGLTSNPPAASTRPALWEKAVELWHDAMPPYRPAFIHRDFHPGNVLWSRRRVSGVVDWANACVGPRGCDVAHCRGNLVDLGGPEVADRFVASYESLTGETFHPYWKLASMLEAGPSNRTPDRLAEQEPYLAQAVAELISKTPQG